MANNRMSIRCKVCGEEIIIAKHYSTPWGLCNYNGKKLYELGEFFEEHYWCQGARDDTYELSYEEKIDWSEE